jgi:hypothetical protein
MFDLPLVIASQTIEKRNKNTTHGGIAVKANLNTCQPVHRHDGTELQKK